MLSWKGDKEQTFTLWKNLDDAGNKTASGTGPDPAVGNQGTVTVQPNAAPTHITFPDPTWQGRIQKGTNETGQVALWGEFQLSDPAGKAWGDISLQRGCDGGATVAPTDGTNDGVIGFTFDCRVGAPPNALITRPDGTQAVDQITTNWLPANPNALTWLESKLDAKNAYLANPNGTATGTGTHVANSQNKCLAWTFY